MKNTFLANLLLWGYVCAGSNSAFAGDIIHQRDISTPTDVDSLEAINVSDVSNPPWEQRGLDIDGESASDFSGNSVSLSDDGSVVAIGAFYNDGNGINSGHVRVYAWDGTAWTQRGLDIDGEAAGDRSGSSVSLSDDGSVVAIGAFYNDGNGSNSGHVRVYAWDGTAWTQRGLDIDGEARRDESGSSVSLSGDGSVVAIGATGNSDYGGYSGHVRVYAWDGTAWTQRGLDIDGEAYDESGGSVSLSDDGSVVAFGATGNSDNGSNSGHVRVFAYSNGPTATETPTALPTTAPAIIVESDHKYAPNTNEEWVVEIPTTTCYTVTMDPQSWTPHSGDVVQIFGIVMGGSEGNVQRRYPIEGGQLFKRRLQDFGTMDINADQIKVSFQSDGSKQAWGFKLYVEKCIGAQ